jgi:formylglycine-generating enzyme required for sulfatase activity
VRLSQTVLPSCPVYFVHPCSLCVDGFWMDIYAVTNEQFQRFVEATGNVTIAECSAEPACLSRRAASLGCISAASASRRAWQPQQLVDIRVWRCAGAMLLTRQVTQMRAQQ